MSAADRNSKIQKLLEEILNSAADHDKVFSAEIESALKTVFESPSRSFREVVLTVTLARIQDLSYQATKDLYACNPRPVYEQGIKPVLEARGIPCTQSGPLNVTKATKAITSEWAAMKTPKEVGLATLSLIEQVDSSDVATLKDLAKKMAASLISEAKQITLLEVEVDPFTDSHILFDMTQRLILEAQDGGNTVQRVAGMLLEVHKETTGSSAVIAGSQDSASTTNLTSKKIGDLSVSKNSGELISVYEVTLKEFSEQRIVECSQSLIGNIGDSEDGFPDVIVLCRAEDVPAIATKAEGGLVMAYVTDRHGIKYVFVDIFQWINIRLLELDKDSRAAYFGKLQAYINLVKTPIEVKKKWSEIVAPQVKDGGE